MCSFSFLDRFAFPYKPLGTRVLYRPEILPKFGFTLLKRKREWERERCRQGTEERNVHKKTRCNTDLRDFQCTGKSSSRVISEDIKLKTPFL